MLSPMNGHGGKRPGAGRPKGAASRANDEVRQQAAATGELPLAYMRRIMRNRSQPVGRRDDMAKAAAPFCHSRLSSVEHMHPVCSTSPLTSCYQPRTNARTQRERLRWVCRWYFLACSPKKPPKADFRG